ncbi:LytR/AlgR family response regulator transcription factor [Deminuibacter soli]|uniref:DNA-binding response regulator n=1 Tax=Deminuibacter soli TaxID=2291815 RepID=A0A3E1NES5_9BACT|nr:LytTR family DNA-binding domain-containing protein [Deminuibacter soli]RFM26377.1 DNA-binding response regulator [Deminuibacter soli]
MRKIKAAIVDDEIHNIAIIRNILETQCENVSIVFTADNLEEAREFLTAKEVDVLFVDIELPEGSSFELLATIPNPKFEVIFVTAHQEYALNAIKMAAMDYILKPVNAGDIVKAIQKLQEKEEFGGLTKMFRNLMQTQNAFSKIVVHVTDGYDVVNVEDIVYVEALDSYSKLRLMKNESYVTSRSLKEFEELLTEKGFYRIHKSHLVNLRHIMKIIKGIAPAVVMANGACIPISTRKKEQFFAELKGIIAF